MVSIKYKNITKCRICYKEELKLITNLGKQPISNQFISKKNSKKIIYDKVPLKVLKCYNCGLVQLSNTVNSNQIYREYWYRSGVNLTMREALKDIKKASLKLIKLKENDLIIDIGCNDGTLLNYFNHKKYQLVGFDPALNLSSNNEKFKRIKNYFSYKNLINSKIKKKAKLITSIAMFYDLDNPNKFVKDIFNSLDDNGLWVIQFADLLEMLNLKMYDQIIHEHLEYYHLKPLEYLLKKNNLKIIKIEKNNVNGSSYRIFVKKDFIKFKKHKSVLFFRNLEVKAKLENIETYNKFNNKILLNKQKLIKLIKGLNKKNKKVFGLGASTKGNVILNYCKFTKKEINYLVDRNPLKNGCKAIGSNIPIISEKKAKELKPDYYLLLPYFFEKEISKREKDFLSRGGKIIVPLPDIKIIKGKKIKKKL